MGGAPCTLSDGTHAYKKPSELKNSWIIPDQHQAELFVSWCFDTDPESARAQMKLIRAQSDETP